VLYSASRTATIFISTGELSGDLHAARLVEALQQRRIESGRPAAIVEANGSSALKAAGAALLFDVAGWSEMGILPNLLKLRYLRRAGLATLRHVLSNNPDMVVLVDSRVLNLELAKRLRRGGYTGRIVYYVAPVRWESCFDPLEQARSLKNRRFLDQREYCDFSIPIYPVSLSAYRELDIAHGFFGHPLCNSARLELSDDEYAALTGIAPEVQGGPIAIAALPGSRIGEVKQIGPPMFSALKLIGEALREAGRPPLAVVALLAHTKLRPYVLDAARKSRLSELLLMDAEYSWDVLHRSRLTLAKSGTGLHQCMLIGAVAVMCYRVAPSLAWLARNFMRMDLPFYGLPNMLAGREVVPELVQEACTAQRIAETAGALLFDETRRDEMLRGYAEIRAIACKPEPLQRIAEAVDKLLEV